jgi:hypothetical protein
MIQNSTWPQQTFLNLEHHVNNEGRPVRVPGRSAQVSSSSSIPTGVEDGRASAVAAWGSGRPPHQIAGIAGMRVLAPASCSHRAREPYPGHRLGHARRERLQQQSEEPERGHCPRETQRHRRRHSRWCWARERSDKPTRRVSQCTTDRVGERDLPESSSCPPAS